ARDVAGDLAPLVFGSEKSAAAAAMLLSVSQETVPTDEEAIEFIDPDQKQPEEEKEEFRQEETSVADVGDTREGIAQDGINPPVKEKLQGIFMKVKNRLLSYVSRVSLPSLPIPGRSSTLYIHRPQDTVSNKSKRFLWIAVVFFLILGISVFWGILRKQTDEKRAEFTSLYESAQTKYEEGAGLLDINVKTARASLLQAKEKLFEAEKLQVEKKKVEELKNMIEEKLVIARREYAPTLETFLPLSLVKDQAKGTSLALFEKKLVILDATNALLYQVDVETKQADIVGGGKDVLSDAVAVAFHGNRAYVLSRTSGIIRFETSSGERLVFEKETVWEDLVDVYAYAGNLYVLDRNGSKVWVYKSSSETKTGFSGIQSWFSQGESYDLSGSIRLSIDGAIWVLFEDGTIERFLSGTKQAYQLSNLEENPLMSASDLFVNEETTFVYVLDKNQGRIVVYVKNTGEYHSQYKAEALKNVKDFIVLEQGKKVIVLTETSLETFDLLLP
ncbi:MAG TPA: hypothetical protein VJB91_00770, partial [Patescibacteria group bacterium]|nr:hypothetical protein [Patescibacteria group bacterium]